MFGRKVSLISLRLASFAGAAILSFAAIRFQSLELAGVIAIETALWTVVRSVAPLGIDLILLRELAQATAPQGNSSFSSLINEAMRRMLLRSALFALGVFAFLALFVDQGFAAASLGALSAFLVPLIGVMVSALRSSKYLMSSQSIDAIMGAAVPFCASAIACWGQGFSVLTFNTIFFASLAITIATLYFLCAKVFGLSFLAKQPLMKNFTMNRTWRVGFSQALVAMNTRLPLLAGATFLSTSVVALFDLSLKFQMVGATIAWMSGTLLSSHYAALGRSNLESAVKLFQRESRNAALLMVSLYVCLLIFTPGLAAILDLPFQSLMLTFAIVGAATVLEAPLNSAGYFLMMTDKEEIVVKIAIVNTATVAVSLVVSLILFPTSSLLVLPLVMAGSVLTRASYLIFLVVRRAIPSPFSIKRSYV